MNIDLNIIRLLYSLERSKFIYLFLGFVAIALIFIAAYTIHYSGIDFNAYLQAAKGFRHGARFYLDSMYKDTYYYPPLTAQLLSPFSDLPQRFLLGMWFFLSVCAMCVSVFLLGGRELYWSNLIVSFGFFPVIDMLYIGQIEAFVLLALSFVFFAVLRNRYFWAGFSLGLAVLIKIIPLANFVYFIWRKQFKIIFAAILTILVLCAISIPFIGWQGWKDFFYVAAYYANPPSMHGINFQQIINDPANQAISGFIARFIQNDVIANRVWRVCVLVFLMATFFVFWRKPKNYLQVFDLEFSLVIITINLIMPYTWYHQFTFLIIPILIFIKRAQNDNTLEKFLWPLAIGYFLTDVQLFLWHCCKNNFLLSMPFFFALLLWGLFTKLILKNNRTTHTGV